VDVHRKAPWYLLIIGEHFVSPSSTALTSSRTPLKGKKIGDWNLKRKPACLERCLERSCWHKKSKGLSRRDMNKENMMFLISFIIDTERLRSWNQRRPHNLTQHVHVTKHKRRSEPRIISLIRPFSEDLPVNHLCSSLSGVMGEVFSPKGLSINGRNL
jgi:predicted Ser/Thr protein kinase